MKVFCETNLLVAAFREDHPQHQSARPVIERVKAGKDAGFVAAHCLAETYAVMTTRLPGAAQVAPTVAWQLISENVLKNFTIVTLTAKEYTEAIKTAAENGVEADKRMTHFY